MKNQSGMPDGRTSYYAQFFTHDHLQEPLKSMSRQFANLASYVEAYLPDTPSREDAMRHLLVAKDAAVRGVIEKQKWEKVDKVYYDPERGPTPDLAETMLENLGAGIVTDIDPETGIATMEPEK